MAQYRFLTSYINPRTGRESIGTGADKQCPHHYASVQNVIKYGLAKPAFPAGQYAVYTWPDGPSEPRFICFAYKRV